MHRPPGFGDDEVELGGASTDDQLGAPSLADDGLGYAHRDFDDAAAGVAMTSPTVCSPGPSMRTGVGWEQKR